MCVYVKFQPPQTADDTFLIVGGYNSEDYEMSRSIYEYDPEEDDWVLYGRALLVARDEAVVIPVPDYVGVCE